VGLCSTVAWTVRARRRELAIRIALGASPRAVTRLVVAGGMKLAVAGIALGTAGALTASRGLSSMVFGITPADAPKIENPETENRKPHGPTILQRPDGLRYSALRVIEGSTRAARNAGIQQATAETARRSAIMPT
jgi:ABC-type antimicrobial peptide transport system permease subunit